MILSRKSFSYQDIVVVEKITIQLPFRYEASFQNEGCFLFMKDMNSNIISISDSKTIHHKNAVLLKCGTYFVDWVNNNIAKQVEVIAFHLPSSILKELYKQELPVSTSPPRKLHHITPLAKDEVLVRFVENLEFYFDNSELVNEDLLSLKVKELILLLLQSSNFQTIQDLFSNIFTKNKVDLKDIVQNHLYTNTSIEDLAKFANMSLSSFKRAFQKQFSTSPGNYFLANKIEKSKSLLSSTSIGISEIAFEVGYNDPSYFTRVFKTKTGYTPSQYRQQHKMD